MASPTFRSAVESTGSTADTSESLTKPAGTVEDDLLVAALDLADEIHTDVTGPSGWTKEEGVNYAGGSLSVWWKVAGASEPASYQWDWNTSSKHSLGIVALIGADTTTPIAISPTPATGSGTTPNPPASGTVTSGDYLGVAIAGQGGKNDNRYTAPSGYTERTDHGTAGGGGHSSHSSHSIATQELTGITSEDPGTFASVRSHDWAAATLLIAAAAGLTTVEGDFTADAIVFGEQTDSLTLDAVIATTAQDGFYADATLLVPTSGSTTLDAVLHGTSAATLDVDAVVLAPMSGSFTLDAWVSLGQTTESGAFALNAVVQSEVSDALTADAITEAPVGGALVVDGVLLGTVNDDAVADAVFRAVQGAAFGADAVVMAPTSDLWGVDAVLIDTRTDELDADAVVRATLGGQTALEATVQAEVQDSVLLAAVIRATVLGGQTLDAALADQGAGQLAVDAVLHTPVANDFSLDATALRVYTSGSTAEAVVLAHPSAAFTVQAIKYDAVPGTDGAFALDAVLLGPIDSLTQADAVLTDTVLSLFDVDAVLLTVPTAQMAVDGVLEAVGVGAITVAADLLATQTGQQTIDANISTVAQYSLELDAITLVPNLGDFTQDAAVLRQQSGSFLADADLYGTMSGQLALDALFLASHVASFGADAIVLATGQDTTTLDAWITAGETTDSFVADAIVLASASDTFTASGITLRTQGYSSTADAWVELVGAGSTTLDAWIQPYFTLDAVVASGTSFTLDAFIASPFSLDATLVRPWNGWITVAAVKQDSFTDSFTLDATYVWREFTVSAIIGTVIHPYAYARVRAWIDIPRWTVEGVAYLDAYIDSYWSEDPFTIDAEIIGTLKEASFTAGADVAGVDEERGTTTLDAFVTKTQTAIFMVNADIVQAPPFTLDAQLNPAIYLDAYVAQYFHLDAAFDRGFTLDATLVKGEGATTTLDAVIDLPWYGATLDAQIAGTVSPDGIEVLAYIVGTVERSLTLDAYVYPYIHLDAFIQPTFRIDAYIMGTAIVVYPPSQEGNDGEVVNISTFHSETGEFDPTMIGEAIIIDGVTYAIAGVPDGHTVTVSPDIDAIGNEVSWSIPSGDPTDPLGNDLPVITRRFRVRILAISPPDTSTPPIDLTGDVIWAQTEFTQSARYGPGTFRITLKGTSSLVGGEEIHVEIDDFRVFGGYISKVERGYIFPDSHNIAKTVLLGTDYNILFDRLVVYNARWDRNHGGGGEYRNWQPYPKGTSDRDIIVGIVNNSLTDMTPYGFDFETYVDEVDTPAPEVPWTTEAGTTWRRVMQSISQVTTAVWWIDAYKQLHYHDRSAVTAPWPLTDGDGGITTRGLSITSDISRMVSDAIVWGTLAYTTAGEIMVSREPSDSSSSVHYWERKIEKLQPKIDKIKLIPASKRTLQQKNNLAAYLKTLDIWMNKLAKAQAAALEDLPQGIYGRWQYGEFRNDIHHQNWLARRADSIFERYGVPIVKAQATVFDLGLQAGMVVSVVSSRHDVADDLVIRQMTIKFTVSKEPVGQVYYAVPQYDLDIGLDPEEPWNIYDYIPWPADIPQRKFDRGGGPKDGEETVADWMWLDTFTREWGPGAYTLGTADNDFDVDDRDWTESGGGGG